MRFAVLGLDHRHIYDQVAGLLAAGATCAGYVPETSDARVLTGFRERFPGLPELSKETALTDGAIEAICCAAIPADRTAIAIAAMRAGKDVMVDKPGAITLGQLAEITQTVAETGRIYSICFTERFVARCAVVAGKLIADGRIGAVIQTIGLGPHRLNAAIRPDWFFDAHRGGGILADVGSHQIDQFLHFTGSQDAEIVTSSVGAFGGSPHQNFGEIVLRNGGTSGYIRVDWFTPDGLPTWGDGRLIILGTEGYIELRKYVDVAGRPGTDHLFIVDKKGVEYIDCSREPLTYFAAFVRDVADRTETAMTQRHVFTVTRLALEAQARATVIGVGA
jgi:predicted dehydrogenase